VSAGVVAGVGRAGLGHAQYEDFIVTDARIARGSSGGALVNAAGELVGISTGILVDGHAGPAFGVAISARLARPVIQQLMRGQPVSRGDVGLDAEDIEPGRARALGLASVDGARLTAVDPGSPAERCGLERGDVVVEANGWAVTRRGHLRAALSTVDSGVSVPIVLFRGGRKVTLTLTPGSRGDGQRSPAPLRP
jgi:serine protease Do